MSDSEGLSDLWHYSDEDSKETQKTQKAVEVSSQKRRFEESESGKKLLDILNNRNKRRRNSVAQAGKEVCTDIDEDEDNALSEEQKELPAKQSEDLLDGFYSKDEDQETNLFGLSVHGQDKRQPQQQQRSFADISTGQDLPSEGLAIQLQKFQQQLQKLQQECCEENEVVEIQDTDTAEERSVPVTRSSQQDQEQTLSPHAELGCDLQLDSEEEEKPEEIYYKIHVKFGQEKMPFKVYRSEKLKEVFVKFAQKAHAQGWSWQNSQYSFSYLGNKIDGWQLPSDVGLTTHAVIDAVLQEKDVSEEKKLKLKFKCQKGEAVSLKSGPQQSFKTIFMEYKQLAQEKGLVNKKQKIVYKFDGDTLADDEKPADYDMEDDDQIDVIFLSK